MRRQLDAAPTLPFLAYAYGLWDAVKRLLKILLERSATTNGAGIRFVNHGPERGVL